MYVLSVCVISYSILANALLAREEADRIVRGCPRQQIRTKASKREAMAYYREMWETQMVEKWVELEDK
jgi:hypothetical protein